jgi:hypothetical protein
VPAEAVTPVDTVVGSDTVTTDSVPLSDTVASPVATSNTPYGGSVNSPSTQTVTAQNYDISPVLSSPVASSTLGPTESTKKPEKAVEDFFKTNTNVTSEIENLRSLGDRKGTTDLLNKHRRGTLNAGWKIHLSLSEESDSVVEDLKKELDDLIHQPNSPIFLGKVGRSADQSGKDATLYIGDGANLERAVDVIKKSKFGKYLAQPVLNEYDLSNNKSITDVEADDLKIGTGIYARFTAPENDKRFHQYGLLPGIPATPDAIYANKNSHGMPTDTVKQLVNNELRVAEEALKEYGSFFTSGLDFINNVGSQTNPVATSQATQEQVSTTSQDSVDTDWESLASTVDNSEAAKVEPVEVKSKVEPFVDSEWASLEAMADDVADTVQVDENGDVVVEREFSPEFEYNGRVDNRKKYEPVVTDKTDVLVARNKVQELKKARKKAERAAQKAESVRFSALSKATGGAIEALAVEDVKSFVDNRLKEELRKLTATDRRSMETAKAINAARREIRDCK